MSTTAVNNNYVKFGGDVEADYILSTGELLNSPAKIDIISLAIGDNTVDVPAVTGYTVHGLVIVPPDGNLEAPILKGDAADVGITLSETRASVIQFGATPPASVILTSLTVAVGFRLIWF